MDPRIRIRIKISWIRNTALPHGSLFSGELVGVVGAVGTGKSSVLAALLGELEKTGGRIALDRPPQGTRAQRRRSWFLFSHCSGPAATRYARSAAESGFLFSHCAGPAATRYARSAAGSGFLFSHCAGPAATRYARSAAGLGFLFSQAVGSVLIPNSSPDPGRPKFSCQYSGLNDLQVLFGLHPSTVYVSSCMFM
jgi:hypothetical protein